MKRSLVIVSIVGLLALAAGLILRQDLGKLDLARFPTRASWQLPERVVAALDLEPGDRIADLGSGEGYFTLYLARAVAPTGRVYAVDIDPEALAAVERASQRTGTSIVETVRARPDDPLLEEGTIDLVFLCNTYHHLADRESYFARLRSDLAPGGRVAIVEPLDHGLARLVNPPGHATPVRVIHEEMAAAGFRPVASFDFLPVQTLQIFAP